MNKLLKLAIISCGFVLSLGFTGESLAGNIETEIKETGVLKVGVRDDSPLFGFGENPVGYCVDFAQELANSLTQEMGQEIKVELVTSTTPTRWDLVKNGSVHLECGPNTISPATETEQNIKFSQAFFVTATQILVNADATEESVSNGTIGIIAGTSNEKDLRVIYPEAQLDNAFTSRSEGVEAVQLGKITGFASDGILLGGTALALGVDPASINFVTPLINERPFCAAYGMILPGGDDNIEWQATVNNAITNSGQGKQVWDTWFTNLLPYIDSVLKACQ
ncbi:MAG: transporter substrate-binding domain-containing protein [Gomphosphaeria aponina SAG 52.96 = DSM 107014]|uniref:Transporter substrate-binding domain-containing protein n=1 Tax=Gomphosphaeria aponina SAG 52.96 = DSM 107014 TaxID=1521640 RepID=A0A941GY75_9CHRO|nr:transporter substrate-binding domain-containing protein [Gomphosphaeria aponina SAG 52.96 = DSM 107014]